MATRCVAGLGNPGERYEWTRHNLGFLIVDRVATMGRYAWKRRDNALEAVGETGNGRVVLLKPLTFMNNSGYAIEGCLLRHQADPEELLVVADDAALPTPRVRIRERGGSGGHRGLASIEEVVGSRDYARLRVGVGGPPEGEELADFLLRPILPTEREAFDRIVEQGAMAVNYIFREGIGRAMNRFNAAPEGDGEGQLGPS